MSGLAQPAQSGPGDDLTEAENRLSEMRTQEVGMVDAAANLRPYLTMKRKDGMSAPTIKDDATAAAAAAPAAPAAAAPEAKQGLTLTTAARDGMMAGLTDALEKLTGVATAIGEATIDEAAATPPEVGELFKQCAELLNSLAGSAAPAAPAVAPAAAPAATAAAAPAAKTEDGTAAETAKAGKALSAANLKKIKTAFDAMKSLLDSVVSAKTEKSAGEQNPEDDDADEGVTAKVHKMLEGFGTKLTEQAAKNDEQIAKLATAIGEKQTTVAEQKEAIAKAKEQIANLSKRANSPGGGNAGSSEGDGTPVHKGNGKEESWGAWNARVNDEHESRAGR